MSAQLSKAGISPFRICRSRVHNNLLFLTRRSAAQLTCLTLHISSSLSLALSPYFRALITTTKQGQLLSYKLSHLTAKALAEHPHSNLTRQICPACCSMSLLFALGSQRLEELSALSPSSFFTALFAICAGISMYERFGCVMLCVCVCLYCYLLLQLASLQLFHFISLSIVIFFLRSGVSGLLRLGLGCASGAIAA